MLRTVLSATAGLGFVLTFAQPAGAQESETQPPPPPPAPSVVGQWELSFETPRGARTMTLVFEMDGDELKGTAETQRGTVQLQEVRFEGTQVAFSMPFGRAGGRGFTIQFVGTLEGDAMEGRLQTPRGNQERPWTAKKLVS